MFNSKALNDFNMENIIPILHAEKTALSTLFVQNFKLVMQSKDTFIHLYVNMACVQRQLPLTQ